MKYSTVGGNRLNWLEPARRTSAPQILTAVEAVGPWERYLGVMHCSGHSSPSSAKRANPTESFGISVTITFVPAGNLELGSDQRYC